MRNTNGHLVISQWITSSIIIRSFNLENKFNKNVMPEGYKSICWLSFKDVHESLCDNLSKSIFCIKSTAENLSGDLVVHLLQPIYPSCKPCIPQHNNNPGANTLLHILCWNFYYLFLTTKGKFLCKKCSIKWKISLKCNLTDIAINWYWNLKYRQIFLKIS